MNDCCHSDYNFNTFSIEAYYEYLEVIEDEVEEQEQITPKPVKVRESLSDNLDEISF